MFNRHDDDRERRWERDRGDDRDRNENRSYDRGYDRDRERFGERNYAGSYSDRGYGDRGQIDRERDWDRDRNWNRENWRNSSSGSWGQAGGNYGQSTGGYPQYDRGQSGSESGYTGQSGYRQHSNLGQGGYGGYSSVHERQSSWAGAGSSGGWNQGGTGGWERAGSNQNEWDRGTSTQNYNRDRGEYGDWRQNAGMQTWGGYGGSYAGGMGSYSGQRQGRYFGKGPKGYQRADDRIREDVNEQLYRHPDVDASDIEVQVQNGEVTLTGNVDERHTKRLAEDVAENVSGVREVHNHLRVKAGILGSVFGSNEENRTHQSNQTNQSSTANQGTQTGTTNPVKTR